MFFAANVLFIWDVSLPACVCVRVCVCVCVWSGGKWICSVAPERFSLSTAWSSNREIAQMREEAPSGVSRWPMT